MIKRIINQFEEVNSIYEKLINITEEKFKSLKVQDEQLTTKLEREEMLMIFDVQESIKKLEVLISSSCKEKALQEETLTSLIPFMTVLEKEQALACQKTAIHYARKLKNNLKMNECLALAFVESNRAIVETMVHVANEENLNKNLFINEEL